MPITINLKLEEFDAAWDIGERRHHHHCERKGRQPFRGGLDQEGCGAVAEFAVTKLVGGKWNPDVGFEHYGSADVIDHCGGELEVKATEYRTGRLFVYKRTRDDLPVVFAVVSRRRLDVVIAGWIVARDAKRDEWWQPDLNIPCWAVTQQHLRPIEELPCLQPPYSQPSSPAAPPTTTETATPPSETSPPSPG